jgi:hypothetical protein
MQMQKERPVAGSPIGDAAKPVLRHASATSPWAREMVLQN